MKESEFTAAAVRRWQLAHLKPASTHSMKTRHRARTFRFLDLPAELRNEIYRHALNYGHEIGLGHVKWPDLAKVNHQLLQETLPIFFAINNFVMSVRCNFHVGELRFTRPEHKEYDSTGQILFETKAFVSAVNRCGSNIILRHLDFDISCGCCNVALIVARLELCNPRLHPSEWFGYKLVNRRCSTAMLQMVSRAAKIDEEHRLKGEVRGWRLEQMRAVAACFRYDEEEGVEALAEPRLK